MMRDREARRRIEVLETELRQVKQKAALLEDRVGLFVVTCALCARNLPKADAIRMKDKQGAEKALWRPPQYVCRQCCERVGAVREGGEKAAE